MTPWNKIPLTDRQGRPAPPPPAPAAVAPRAAPAPTSPVPTTDEPPTCIQGFRWGRRRRRLRPGRGQVLRRLFGPGVLLRWQRRLRLFFRAGRLPLPGVLGRRVPRRRWRVPAEGAPRPARPVRQVQRKRPHGHGRLGHAVSQHRHRGRLSPRPRAGGGRGPLLPRRLLALRFGRGQRPRLPARPGQRRLLVSSCRGQLLPRVSGGHRGASRHRPLAPAAGGPGPGSPGPGGPAARLSAGAPTGSGLGRRARQPGRRRRHHRRPRRPRPCSARRAAPPRVEQSANRPSAQPAFSDARPEPANPRRAPEPGASREPSPGAGSYGGAATRAGAGNCSRGEGRRSEGTAGAGPPGGA